MRKWPSSLISSILSILVIISIVTLMTLLVIKHSSVDNQSVVYPLERKVPLKLGEILKMLSENAVTSPTAPMNTSCLPDPLPRLPTCKGQPGLSGERLNKPRKIVLMFLFGFEADVLEIALKQQHDLVDKIFLVESSSSHRGTSKMLMWERLKFSERFSFVDKQKVLHIVANDRIRKEWSENEWVAEDDQSLTGVERIMEWSMNMGHLDDDDILISANVDEILSRDVLHQLKWCELASDVIFGAIWMPMGNLNNAIKVDMPSEHGQHLFLQPTIYKWSTIRKREETGKRIQCHNANYKNCSYVVKGGIHLTNSAYLPTNLLKEFTATEESYYSGAINWNFLFSASTEMLNKEQDRLYNLEYRPMFLDRIDILSSAPDVDADVPYHLRCNKDRFPYWYGKHDPRNKKLKERIEKFKQKHKFSVENKCPFIYNLAYVTVNKTSFGAVKTCPSAADDNF